MTAAPRTDDTVAGLTARPDVGEPVLDNPAWGSLTGHHRRLATIHGRAAILPPEVHVFAGLADHDDPGGWDDLAFTLGPRRQVVLTAARLDLPAGWIEVERGDGVQFVATSLDVAPDPEAVELGADDVPEMLDLVARTQPGPFFPRTIELGRYLGIRRDGRLVAMAGERLHPPGWTEISAVCTDPAARGQGLATRLVRAVGHGIRLRGEQVFLHTGATNTPAIGLYDRLGFTLRSRKTFALIQSPAEPAPRR